MRRKFAALQQIEGKRKVTSEMDQEFLRHLQYGLLLALKERGTLTAMQFHLAEERLREQQRRQAGKGTDS